MGEVEIKLRKEIDLNLSPEIKRLRGEQLPPPPHLTNPDIPITNNPSNSSTKKTLNQGGSRKMFNLSGYNLNPYEIRLLEKGLSFCPTNKVDEFQLFLDLNAFTRKLTLTRHFSIASSNPHPLCQMSNPIAYQPTTSPTPPLSPPPPPDRQQPTLQVQILPPTPPR